MPVDSKEQRWLTKAQRAPQWLDLLYDLVIIAVLTVFTVNHEITGGPSTLVYFSYFVIIWWVWASQVLYDVRFEANDWVHRLFKFCQLGTFAFLGVTAQSFDPSNVLPPESAVESSEAAQQSLGASAWTGVATSYAAGRLFLILEYVLVLITTRHYKRHLPSLLVPPIVAFISGVLWAISASMTGNAAAKVACAYSGLGLEVEATLMLPLMPQYMRAPPEMISERFGALSLIIIGEGIIGIIRSFSAVMAGFGFSSVAYGQCFCALVIITSLWYFLFDGFNVEIRMGRKRGLLWIIFHFPLHFSILLVLIGMRNTATFGNITHALDIVNQNMLSLFADIDENNFNHTSAGLQYMSIQLGKLSITPSWPEEIRNILDEASNPNSTQDPVVDVIQYQVQIYIGIAAYYDVQLSDDVLHSAEVINSLNGTRNPDSSTWNATYDEYVALGNEFDQEYQTDLGNGVLFFLPSAGGFLFVLSILHLLRSLPLGGYMWASWTSRLVGGIGLGLLGLLDLGDKTLNEDMTSPIFVYRLQQRNWMLPVVAIVYAVLIIFDSLLMVLADRQARHRRGPVIPHTDQAGPRGANSSVEARGPECSAPHEETVLPGSGTRVKSDYS
ncbi:hypothetical protein DACRYDRAFT_119534 [Dacryopinax primogenitus]|uniref:Low temperature requirement protein A n=1 Tax=Dacryopinax primogenitus (strain DJM 731) TaxID=1858805 RepID=M5FVR1_DACPD|nr:uncharacterized protein DACRYDRAFT_119534 [Dacryopinax primogenitus]EJT97451.1 hypothetical protein DACRYDRAFT_119534 [Dacryopinax primogenitus]